jgi:hypothetical protein
MKMQFKFPLLLLLAALVLPFSSCNNDDEDDGGGGASPSVEGMWQISYLSNTNCTDEYDNIVLDLTDAPCFDFFGVESCFDIEMNFKADGSFVQTTTTEATFMGQTTTDTETEEGTYSINGSTITLCDSDGDCDDGEFTISGNNITITTQANETDGCDSELRGVRL